jgi:hypothetical protein
MAIMGELSDLGILDLLELLSRRERSGRLTVKADGREIEITLAKGQVVQVSSSDPSLRLGNMLVRRGALSPHRLLEILHQQSEHGHTRTVGQILISRGGIAAGELASCVEEQCVTVLAQLISARQGVFVFVDGAVNVDDVAVVPPPLDQLLAEAVQQTEELMALRARLPSPSAPIIYNPTATTILKSLTDVETKIVKLVRRATGSYADLAAQLPYDELTLTKAVLGLHDRGLLTIYSANGVKPD